MTQKVDEYRGFVIEKLGTSFTFIRAKKLVEDKLDTILMKNSHLWADNISDEQRWSEQDLIKTVKAEIDHYRKEKLEILDDIIVRISKGEQL